jgi:hypothetical protein
MLALDNGQIIVALIGLCLLCFSLMGLMSSIHRYINQRRMQRIQNTSDAVESGEYILQKRVPYRLDEDGNVIDNE